MIRTKIHTDNFKIQTDEVRMNFDMNRPMHVPLEHFTLFVGSPSVLNKLILKSTSIHNYPNFSKKNIHHLSFGPNQVIRIQVYKLTHDHTTTNEHLYLTK